MISSSATGGSVRFTAAEVAKVVSNVKTDGIENTDRDAAGASDILYGYAGSDRIYGGKGDDTIDGGSDNDFLYGGEGVDTMYGGSGADEIHGGSQGDVIYGFRESGKGDATDTANDSGDTLYGEEGGDTIRGNAGADYLYGGSGADKLFGDADDDYLYGEGEPDTIEGGAGNDFIWGNIGADKIYGQDGNDTIYGEDGGDEIYAGANDDTIHIGTPAGATQRSLHEITSLFIVDGGIGSDTMNLDDRKDATSNHTGSITNNSITGLGMGGPLQYSALEFLNIALGIGKHEITIESTHAGETNLTTNAGDDKVYVKTISGKTTIDTGADNDLIDVGSLAPSMGSGNVDSIGALLVVRGGIGTDVVNVDDAGDASDNTGSLMLDHIGGLDMAAGIDYFDLETLNIDLGSGSDTFTVESTHTGHTTLDVFAGKDTINVKTISGVTDITTGLNDDLITIGSAAPTKGGTVDMIGAALSIQAEGGADTMTVDDSGDASDNTGTLRTTKIEGLDTASDITFGGLEVLALYLGSGNDTFTVNDTVQGMTIIEGGAGTDDIRVMKTRVLPNQQTEVSSVVTATTIQEGDRHANPAESEIVQIDINARADVGYFVLEFVDQNLDPTDPSGDDTVPGAEQTVVLPYTVTAAQLREALGTLRLVGGASFVDVTEDTITESVTTTGAVHRYTVTFSSQLGNLPSLRCLDTKLFVAGQAGADEISIQSIDQPTYILGGSVLQQDDPMVTEDDKDILNVNVQIGINGPELAAAPDGLNAIPPAKAIANGVNAQLMVDGGAEGDTYYVYLFGGTVDSQINLFDSGVTTDDSSFLFGTESADMFLMRAAVANDGLAFVP